MTIRNNLSKIILTEQVWQKILMPEFNNSYKYSDLIFPICTFLNT